MRIVTQVVLFIASFVAMLARKIVLAVRPYNAVRLRVWGSLPDRHNAPTLLEALSGRERSPTLLDVLVALDRARRDPRVRILLVEIGALHCGLARVEEIRSALETLTASGCKTVAYLEEGATREYLLALGASQIVLAPAGGLGVSGVASEITLLKGLLDKAGIEAQLEGRGKYKSARETFTEEASSAASREMAESLVGDLYDQFVTAVAARRKLEPDRVRALIDAGPFRAEQAVAAGLADRTGYLEEIEESFEKEFPDYRALSGPAYLRLSVDVVRAPGVRATPVALLEVAGHIKSGRSVPGADGTRATGSRTFLKQLKGAADDPRVEGIVLRVDSPGGSGLASDVMWHALKQVRTSKPVVVSMGDVAASGGYYVAALPSVPVYASEATLTGSIGVFGGKFVLGKLYEKLGVRREIVAKGRHASFYSESIPYSDEELQKLAGDIDAFYKDFVAKMAEGRGRSYEEIHAVAQGRVWTGRQALQSGLVDERGGLLDALRALRRRLGIGDDAPLALIQAPGRRPRLPVRWQWNFSDSPLDEAARAFLKPLEIARWLGNERVLALMPFELRIL